ncbi:CBS domain-containing protein [Thermococcus sp. GR7]|uniref:chloride channel protein n=1 Tax=unclassified Thermococcus TaxID=2627626 RepID=UPI001431F40C|nr:MULTISPECIES: chloride channel protein [unclassified Thermococcus]NJE46405.1 CBS domain-containing protein [Thermococcus sp. GR7]NJE77676.1 CBS domain-containing protein [Thermococcus sp. GR4]NJF23715.1 CBS domain-containing protein [Thermococcus sp. GR5]
MDWENRRYVRKWVTVLVLAVLAGLAGGIGAVLFRLMVASVGKLFFSFLLPLITYEYHGYNLGYIFLPALGGLLIAPLVRYAPNIKGNGVPEVIEAVIFRSGNIGGKFAFLKIIATSISIGTGASLGREGPIAFIGAAMSSGVTQLLKLPPEKKKLLTTCGLAAGIAGTFNTPLAGAMFALEVIYMGAFSINLVPIFLSAIVGNAVTLLILGSASGITIPSGLSYHVSELFFFFALGILFGLMGVVYIRVLYTLIDRFEGSRLPVEGRLFLGGMAVGVMGMFFPNYGIFGVGYKGMDLAMLGELTLTMLIALGLVKMAATTFSIASGYSGGIFAPSLYIGTMFGSAFGILVQNLCPSLPVHPSSYALAGMAAFFSAITQAPLTQIIMITEMTKSYTILPPIMLSSTLSFLVARAFLRGSSVYTLKLERKGLHVKTGKPVILETISVREIMTSIPVYVHENETLFKVEKLIAKTGHDCFPVVNDEHRVVGVIGVKDILGKSTKLKALPVKRFLRKNYAVTCPMETAQDALEKLLESDQNLLPVVENFENMKLIGVITKKDIYRAYYRGLEGMYIE